MKLEGKVRVRDWDLIQTPLYPNESLNFKGHREYYFYTDILSTLPTPPNFAPFTASIAHNSDI